MVTPGAGRPPPTPLDFASQKFESRILLPYKNVYHSCNIFYDKMILIFFVNTIAKLHVKWLTVICADTKVSSAAALCRIT